jgi:hypothetical protein
MGLRPSNLPAEAKDSYSLRLSISPVEAKDGYRLEAE